jgi:hypothetical protein
MRCARAIATVAVALGLLLPATARASTPSGFTLVPPPAGLLDVTLAGVDAASHTAAWAVGERPSGSLTRPVILRWNGISWAAQTLPSTVGAGTLSDVDVVSPADVWAVGTAYGSQWHGLVLHWDGVRWSRMVAPAALQSIRSVQARSARNAYVFGSVPVGPDSCSLDRISRWDGTSWSAYADFEGFCTDGPTFGDLQLIPGGPLMFPGGVFLHELGGSVPAVRCYLAKCPGDLVWPYSEKIWGGFLSAASGSGPNDMWISATLSSFSRGDQPAMLRWRGHWRLFRLGPYEQPHHLADVVELSMDDVWAVGFRRSTSDPDSDRTYIVHWDGDSWTDLGGPNRAGGSNVLTGVARVPGRATEMWAVGTAPGGPLLLHHE